jgi:hypothetical protein
MVAMDYRTRDGLADYGFSIEPLPGDGWRVYIILQPFCQADDAASLPYQSIDSKGRRYVDWPAKLANLGEAKTVAGLWVELVEPYRRAQEQKALYVGLIEHCLRSRQKRKPAHPTQECLDDAVSTGRKKSQRGDRMTDEVA